MAQARRKNPQDLTLRNLRAHAKRIAALERECKALRIQLNRLDWCLNVHVHSSPHTTSTPVGRAARTRR